jgi:hypothetical protein
MVTQTRRLGPILLLVLLACSQWAVADEPQPASIQFKKQVLTERYFCDGVSAGDFNRDGHLDVVAGPSWHAGPAFGEHHEFYPAVPLVPEKSPSNSMYSYVFDFNQDGWQDILVLGRVHLHPAYWYENPRGRDGYWQKHYVFERVQGESPPLVDIDGDGRPELICHNGKQWGWIAPDWTKPAEPWKFHAVTAASEYQQFYHGTGVGDVNGDGRLDLILNDGWWEQPAGKASGGKWQAHPFRFAKRGGAQMFARDVDGDGDSDIITSLDAHGWGLAWFEQVGEGGETTFREHKIMGDRSEESTYGVAFTQPHALAMADLDGDGLVDLVVGKRRWAHGPEGDIEPMAAPVVYWFQLVRSADGKPRFVPHLIDNWSGVGLQITIADLDGDHKPDILTASKLGVFLFRQQK